MSTVLQSMQAAIAAAAATAQDMSEAQTGGGSKILPEGYAFARLVEYIEYGQQPQEFNGKAKDPALEVQLGWALWGEGYQNEDGTPYILRPYPMSLSRNPKAGSFLLFKALNWKGQSTNFAQFLGQAFLAKIVTKQPKDASKKPYSTIDPKGFLPPLDPVTKAPYPIPEARDQDYKVFFWDHPTKETWDALYVDGTWDDGKSKNKIQNTILGAVDFEGSALQLLFGGQLQALKPAAKAVQAPPAGPSALLPPTPAAAPLQPPAPVLAPAVPATPVIPVAVPLAPLAPPGPAMPALPTAPF